MSWSLERNDDGLNVRLEPPFASDWQNLFEAIKIQVETGVRTIVFPRAASGMSVASLEALETLVRYLLGTGVEVRREG